MSVLAAVLLAIFIFGAIGLVLVFITIKMVQGTVHRVANRAIDNVTGIGMSVANKTTDRLLNIGEKELVKGIESAKKAVSKSMLESDPKKMAIEVTKIAEKHKGELTVSRLMAELSISKSLSRKTLDDLASQKICEFTHIEGREVYIFSSFKEKRQVKKCDYCGSVFDMDDAQDKCLSCGANLRVTTVLK